jgi:NADH-quinone oxidoreductase subunit N
MTYGNFAALAQKNFKRMLAYSSIAHAGYMLGGVAAAGASKGRPDAAGAVLFYLVVYAFGNVGAFALAAWLARDKGSDEIEDLNGLALRHPFLSTCVLMLMLSLIGMPPLAGFFGKLYMFMEALDERVDPGPARLTLIWLVALGLLNSVVSAFYYVRVLKAMYLRPESGPPMSSPPSSVMGSIVLATAVSLGFGVFPTPLISGMKSAAVLMLGSGGSFLPESVFNPDRPAILTKPMPDAADPKAVTPPAPPNATRSGRGATGLPK